MTTETLEKSTYLSRMQTLTPQNIFEDGDLTVMIDKIEAEVATLVFDPSDENGRKEIKSLAYKVAQSKTFIDKTRKAYIDDKQEFIKKVNSVSKSAIERLQALQDKVRKPVTDFEEAEEKRIQGIKNILSSIKVFESMSGLTPSKDIKTAIKIVEKVDPETMYEFKYSANNLKNEMLEFLSGLLIMSEEFEEKEAQRIKLENDQKLRDQKEREDKIKLDAIADAEKNAQAKIDAEKIRIQQEAQEKIDQAKKENDAKLLAAQKDAEDLKRSQDKEKADQKARDDKALADKEKYEQDLDNRKRVNNAIKEAFVSQGLRSEDAQAVVILIAKGLIPHLKINYAQA